MKFLPPSSNRKGFSLVEVMIAMTLMAVAMMTLASAAALGLTQMSKARQDLQYSADVQQVADSIVGVGWNRVSSGSSSIRGRPVAWTVTTINPASQRVDIIVERRGHASQTTVYQDTVTLFLAKVRLQ
ncbi:MAG TPA: prepilin-type N-terminal cleavage/methylation domain-containing protein [Gemmatimonadaceae bacterium]|nr:prepilin-type N-terminal cleavage/methylation domain-containing protein [Gemmatimonadaceae bacterium]